MGCQTTYSPPITIPTGLTGATGDAGSKGTNGAMILENDPAAVASTGTGNQTLKTYSTPTGAESVEDGDELSISVKVKFDTAFVGSVSIKAGSDVLLTHSIGTNDVYTPAYGSSYCYLDLNAKYTSTTGETIFKVSSTIDIIEDTVTKVSIEDFNITNDLTAPVSVSVTCNPSAGTIYVERVLITLNKIA